MASTQLRKSFQPMAGIGEKLPVVAAVDKPKVADLHVPDAGLGTG